LTVRERRGVSPYSHGPKDLGPVQIDLVNQEK
jgi:hypothetical protein